MSQPVEQPTFSRLLRSPSVLLLSLLICTVVLWIKLDAISQRLAQHEPKAMPAGEPAHGDTPAHAGAAGEQEHGAQDGRSELPHLHGPFQAASHPPKGHVSIVPEWAPARYVVFALPALRTADDAYLDLLGRLADVCLEQTDVEVLVVLGQNDVAARTKWDAIINQRKLDRNRLRLVEARSLDSIWIRDYGPIFVRREEDGQLFVVDTAYHDLRPEATDALLTGGSALRPADDLFPIYFSSTLDLPFLHPGFAMNGGDLYADGRGVLYTSEETLRLNNGDREFLSGMYRAYFGVRQARYLQPLPGPTVKHIDMVFKLASPEVCLVGEYRHLDGNGDLPSLQRAAARALDENTAQLVGQGLQVVRVPMPDIQRITKWDYYGHVFSEEDRRKRAEDLAEGAQVAPEEIRERLASTYAYVYRTYLNSVLLVSGSAAAAIQTSKEKRLLIVPRYGSTVPSELEAKVARAYREAYGGNTEIVFVEAETLAYANGSVRCIMSVVPAGS